MRILQIINWHRHGGGSDFMARATAEVLREAGHEVNFMSHDSQAYEGSLSGKLSAALTGIYSPRALAEVRACLNGGAPLDSVACGPANYATPTANNTYLFADGAAGRCKLRQ